MFFRINKTAIFCSFLLLLSSSVSYASSWASIADEIAVTINQTTQLYRDGNIKMAKRKIIEAYFGIFESKKFEAAMRQEMGNTYAYEVERKFGSLRKMIREKKPLTEIEAIAKDIITTVRKDAAILDKQGIPLHVFDPTK